MWHTNTLYESSYRIMSETILKDMIPMFMLASSSTKKNTVLRKWAKINIYNRRTQIVTTRLLNTHTIKIRSNVVSHKAKYIQFLSIKHFLSGKRKYYIWMGYEAYACYFHHLRLFFLSFIVMRHSTVNTQ